MASIPVRAGGAAAAVMMLTAIAGCGTVEEAARTVQSTTASAAASGGSPSTDAAPSAFPDGVVTAALPADVGEKLQRALDETRNSVDFPGVIAGVWTPEGRWNGASGTNAPTSGSLPTAADHTRIGTVTDSFTTTVLLQLADEDLLSLDDAIEIYYPGLPNGSAATLYNLATMTSGIPSYADTPAFTEQYAADPSTVYSPQELVDFIAGLPADFGPGAEYEYSATNTVLLGMVIEQVTGQPIADVFAERIFTPLELEQTSWPGDSADLPTPHLSGVTQQVSTSPADSAGDSASPTATPPLTDATGWNPSWSFTSGEIISDLDDLHVWSVALATGKGILSDGMQKVRLESLEASVPPNTAASSYGLGLSRVAGWLGATGDIPGYSTSISFDPKSGTSIVVLVNSDIDTDGVEPSAAVTDALVAALGDATSE